MEKLTMKGRGVLRAVSLMAPLIVSTLGCSTTSSQPPDGKKYEVSKTDAQWRKALSPEQFRILRQKGTERAFTGQYWNEKQKGIYRCAGCNQPLFSSEHKFRSGTGWPSYYQAIEPGLVDTISDTSFGMVRTEILCSRCGGHLGHVFRDGPEPTGLRYCVNSASLVLDTKADRSVVDK